MRRTEHLDSLRCLPLLPLVIGLSMFGGVLTLREICSADEMPAPALRAPERSEVGLAPAQLSRSIESRGESIELCDGSIDESSTRASGPPARKGGWQQTHGLAFIARRADEHLRQGLDLAERGATYSARAKFIQALRLIAEALDVEGETHVHSRGLSAGLTALREADDFVASGSRLITNQDLRGIIAAHRTPVLKQVGDEHRLTPLLAMQQYYTYAERQLALAGGRVPPASMAFYSLARLQPVLESATSTHADMAGPKSMSLHRVALEIDPRNYKAANELGVLLARHGQLEEARQVFIHSAAVSSTPETWYNLSVIYHQRGEVDQARQLRARYESVLARQEAGGREAASGNDGSEPRIRWVDSDTFAASSDPAGLGSPPVKPERLSKPSSTASSKQRNENNEATQAGRRSLLPGFTGLGSLFRTSRREGASPKAPN